MKRLFQTLIIIVLMFASNSLCAQQTAFANVDLYVAVVNRLFQHQMRQRPPETLLRYTFCGVRLPNRCRELQIVVREDNGNQLDLETWRLPQSSPDIWDQLATLAIKTPDIAAEQAARLINIQHETKTISNSSRLSKLMREARSLSAPLTADDTVTTDGSEYHFEINSISKKLSITLQGPPLDDASAAKSPIIRWMAQVRDEVERNIMTPNPAKP